MTAIDTSAEPPGPPDPDPPGSTPATTGAGPATGSSGRQPLTRSQLLRAIGIGLTLLGLFLLGFAGYLYGASSIQEARAQTVGYTSLRYQLGQGTAPLGPTVLCSPTTSRTCPTAGGTPMAILTIPAIGIRDMVVVYGTSPENLTLGPGVIRSGPLPGQSGVSTIYGRRATFGAPFGRIARLRPGDIIITTTGQGVARYKVAALGSSSREVEDPAANRLVLLTAGSATVPTYYTYVDADLISSPKAAPSDLPAIFSDETALSGDSGALTMTLLWAFALAAVSVGGTLAASRWAPWPTYLATAPVVLIVLWNLYQNLAALLPNVY